MAEPDSTLTGTQRAAVFLLGLGEEGAAAIMRHMEPKEVQRVGEAMASLPSVSNEQVAAVVGEFSEAVGKVNPIGIGASDFTRRVMVQALGETKARSMLGSVLQRSDTRGIDALRWMDARTVTEMIGGEHPQIIAIVLASLEGEQAAKVLSHLPESQRGEIMLRVARLDLIDSRAMQELDRVLEKQLGEVQKAPPQTVDGLSSAAGILNHMDAVQEGALMDIIKEADDELGDRVSDLMFVFDNLLAVDARGMQRLIRDIAVDRLVIALKGVDVELQNKFFENMSSRAAAMLQEDLEAKGPVKLSDVEAAQKEILLVAKRLADDGEISMGRGGEDFV